MKILLSLLGVGIVAVGIFFFANKPIDNVNEDYMRIHIVANSNSRRDEDIKYLVKDAVVEFLIPYLAEAENKEEASQIILSKQSKIIEVINSVLKNQGVNYHANVKVIEENIPTRGYDNLVLDGGVYECLRIELGNAKGDNWWCVVFPAVCFVNSKNPQNYEYISKIWDMIYSVTK